MNDINLSNARNKLSKINSINYKVGMSWNELDPFVKSKAQFSISTFNFHVKKSYISKYNVTCTKEGCYVCGLREKE